MFCCLLFGFCFYYSLLRNDLLNRYVMGSCRDRRHDLKLERKRYRPSFIVRKELVIKTRPITNTVSLFVEYRSRQDDKPDVLELRGLTAVRLQDAPRSRRNVPAEVLDLQEFQLLPLHPGKHDPLAIREGPSDHMVRLNLALEGSVEHYHGRGAELGEAEQPRLDLGARGPPLFRRKVEPRVQDLFSQFVFQMNFTILRVSYENRHCRHSRSGSERESSLSRITYWIPDRNARG